MTLAVYVRLKAIVHMLTYTTCSVILPLILLNENRITDSVSMLKAD